MNERRLARVAEVWDRPHEWDLVCEDGRCSRCAVTELLAEVRRLRAFIVRLMPYDGSDAAVYAAEARQDLGLALAAPDPVD